jgi:glutamyl-tRNA synthetase
MKIDGNSKRKLSKRKDPELALAYYQEEGISQDAVWEFLLTVLNSNFEEWRIANPKKNLKEFDFTLEKMSNSGCLVDLDKLNDVSKNVISRMDANTVYEKWHAWCMEYNPQYAELIEKYHDRTIKALNIGRNTEKPRRDLENWKQTCNFMSFYYEELFTIEDNMNSQCDENVSKAFFAEYIEKYNHDFSQAEWFNMVKTITEEMGFAVKPKDYKKNPDLYKGSIVHITNMIRIALTGRANAPDIWEVSQVLGEDIVRNRLSKWC